MEYISNGIYKFELNGIEVQASAQDLRDIFLQIKKYEGSEVNDYVETCPWNYIYEDSTKFELLVSEIKDSGFKNVKWSDELESVLDTAVYAAMKSAHNWYTSLYHMEKKI